MSKGKAKKKRGGGKETASQIILPRVVPTMALYPAENRRLCCLNITQKVFAYILNFIDYGILSCIYSIWHVFWHSIWHIYILWHSTWYFSILSGTHFRILSTWNMIWHAIWQNIFWHSIVHSICWGPVVPTEIGRSRLSGPVVPTAI